MGAGSGYRLLDRGAERADSTRRLTNAVANIGIGRIPKIINVKIEHRDGLACRFDTWNGCIRNETDGDACHNYDPESPK